MNGILEKDIKRSKQIWTDTWTYVGRKYTDNIGRKYIDSRYLSRRRCDQIGRFFGLWTTFQSLWEQLNCQNLPQSYEIFVKVSKSIIFLVKSFLGNFFRHLAVFFWSHW